MIGEWAWGLFQLLVILVMMATLFLVLVSATAKAEVLASPVVWPECLNRDVQVDLVACGAQRWQLDAIDAITLGGRSKGPVDYIQIAPETSAARRDEVGLGWGHFTAGRRGLPAPEPNTSDLNHYWTTLAFLHSDQAPCVLFDVWNHGNRNVAAEAAICPDSFRTAAVAVANSNPTLARRLVRDHACDVRALLLAYYESHPTDHRRRRIEWLLGRI